MDVAFTAGDGVDLNGWFIPSGQPSGPAVVLVRVHLGNLVDDLKTKVAQLRHGAVTGHFEMEDHTAGAHLTRARAELRTTGAANKLYPRNWTADAVDEPSSVLVVHIRAQLRHVEFSWLSTRCGCSCPPAFHGHELTVRMMYF